MYDSYKKCSKCGSRKLLMGFGINNRGEAYKTCECCRIKDRVNREKYSPNRERYSYIEEHTNYLNKDNDN
jgi:hypothetical protein